MPRQIYVYLLILCGIWSQGIIKAFAEDNVAESSSFLGRQKRVISRINDEDIPVRIDDYPYVVNIKRNNRLFCVGSILSQRVVITSAGCATYDKSSFKVISSSVRSNRAIVSHNVTEIKVHSGNYPGRSMDGIALFTIDPPVEYNRFSYKIDLHVGPVLQGMHGTVLGWGFDDRNDNRGTAWPSNLRSIKVPIMAHRDCVNRYEHIYPISDKDVCTFHGLRYAGHTDAGAPLVMDNFLVGVFLRRGQIHSPFTPQYPDVFAFVQHTHYREWIRANI